MPPARLAKRTDQPAVRENGQIGFVRRLRNRDRKVQRSRTRGKGFPLRAYGLILPDKRHAGRNFASWTIILTAEIRVQDKSPCAVDKKAAVSGVEVALKRQS